MPKGPQGQKRSADVIGNAVHVMRIATGQESEIVSALKSAAAELGRKGGNARATSLDADQRKAVAQKAAKARWDKRKK